MKLVSWSPFILFLNFQAAFFQKCDNISLTCTQNDNCLNCIRAHHCCHWCYDQSMTGSRCNTLEALDCPLEKILFNSESKMKINDNPPFADYENTITEAVQFRPSNITINLRINEPINVTIQYRPAKNFPLDLYYLMDLTNSMEPDLKTLETLGEDLATTLSNFTKNYKISFGSYIDKPTMPFYFTDERQSKNPCSRYGKQCQKGYLFKHQLNFTKDITEFVEKVRKSDVSANLDNLEGGMDALMQILLCSNRIGWLPDSRKLVLIATEGIMHFAGDGILSGSARRNRKRCLIDSEGNYKNPIRYDYPSIEEIFNELRSKKVNLIFASKNTSFLYYDKMSELLEDVSFVGELQKDSRNVLQLVREGYHAFMKQVTLFVNTSDIAGLEVEYFTDCFGNQNWTKTDTCMNAEEDKTIDFKLQFWLKTPQNADKGLVYVEEAKINDKILVNLNFPDSKCNCPNISENKTCVNGVIDCGNCTCDLGWTGNDCNTVCINDVNNCRFEENGIKSLTCSSNGDCICSKCTCNYPYSGQFCQYLCPIENGLICAGHGNCIDGQCQCYANYIQDDCSCYNSTYNCLIPGTEKLCTDNGICECNQCRCKTGEGKYCEICENCEGMCSYYEPEVKLFADNTKGNSTTIKVEIVDQVDENLKLCSYKYTNKKNIPCIILYNYIERPEKHVLINAMLPNCSQPLSAAAGMGMIIGAIILLGLIGILVYKLRNMYRDKREYAAFIKNTDQSNPIGENPLYRSPVTVYNNPMELTTFQKKLE